MNVRRFRMEYRNELRRVGHRSRGRYHGEPDHEQQYVLRSDGRRKTLIRGQLGFRYPPPQRGASLLRKKLTA